MVKKGSVRTSYQDRLKPTKEQASIIDNTLDMLRCQYNYGSPEVAVIFLSN